MASKDQFADLFSSATSKKLVANLSLAERQKEASLYSLNNGYSRNKNNNNNNNNNQWGDLDLLGGSTTTMQDYHPKLVSNDPFQEFETLNGSNVKHASSNDLFKGFGADGSSSTIQPNNPGSGTHLIGKESSQTKRAAQSQDIDDLFAVFDTPLPPKQSEPQLEIPKPFNPSSNNQLLRDASNEEEGYGTPANDDARDDAVASLIDMGFDIDKANEALNHTSDGRNIQEAISYIMNTAHQKSRANQGPTTGIQERFQLSNDTPASIFANKAAEKYINNFSNILGSMGNKVMKEANKFLSTPNITSDGKPAWMKDQSKYKAQNGNFEEDPDELDEETIRRLTLEQTQRQRQKDLERLNERRDRVRPERSQSVSEPTPKVGLSTTASRSHSTRPSNLQGDNSWDLQNEEKDLFSPLPSKPMASAEPEVDLFSSPVPPGRPASTNDEMKTSSRRRSKPTTPSSTSTPTPKANKLRTSTVSVSSTQMEFFKDSREQGSISFKKGDFATALTHYQTALDALPQNHPLRIIAYSNYITALFKVGENKKVVELSELANSLIGPRHGVDEDVEPGKSIKEFWIKINTKKAESLEHLEKFEESLKVWTELIENGAANKTTLDGKRRCQKNLAPAESPKFKATTLKPSHNSSQSIHLRKPQPGPRPDSAAVKNIQKTNQANEQFEQDKFKLYDQVEAKINEWKAGKEDNLRALLSSLQMILWPSANWKVVTMGDLVIPKKVKIVYLKAVSKVHPDKVPQDATSEQKLIAQSVFVVINQAWEGFKVQNGIQ